MSEPLSEQTGREILEAQKHTNRLLEALVTNQVGRGKAKAVLESLGSEPSKATSKVDEEALKQEAMSQARQRAAKNGFAGVTVKEGVHTVAKSKTGGGG